MITIKDQIVKVFNQIIVGTLGTITILLLAHIQIYGLQAGIAKFFGF